MRPFSRIGGSYSPFLLSGLTKRPCCHFSLVLRTKFPACFLLLSILVGSFPPQSCSVSLGFCLYWLFMWEWSLPAALAACAPKSVCLLWKTIVNFFPPPWSLQGFPASLSHLPFWTGHSGRTPLSPIKSDNLAQRRRATLWIDLMTSRTWLHFHC